MKIFTIAIMSFVMLAAAALFVLLWLMSKGQR